MNLREKIETDLKKALKEGDKISLSVLRMVLAAIKNAQIDKNSELTSEDYIQVLQKEVKTRRQSVEEYTKAKRLDLAEKEQAEILIIKKYLPTELSDEELINIVKDIIKDFEIINSQEIGKIIGITMKKVSGKADGSRVAAIVKSLINQA